MQIKGLLTIAALSASAIATAEVVSQNTMCRIEISGSEGQSNLIIAVPLNAAGGGNVKITDLVMTDNLEENDALIANVGGTYYSWVIKGGVWTAATTTDGDKEITSGDDAKAALSVGTGAWLVRKTPSNAAYLYGQVPTSGSKTTTMGLGTAEAPKYTLIGNPTTAAKAINGITWANANEGDQIAVPGTNGKAQTYIRRGPTAGGEAKWCKYVKGSGYVATEAKIAPGCGFWYISYGGTVAPTATW